MQSKWLSLTCGRVLISDVASSHICCLPPQTTACLISICATCCASLAHAETEVQKKGHSPFVEGKASFVTHVDFSELSVVGQASLGVAENAIKRVRRAYVGHLRQNCRRASGWLLAVHVISPIPAKLWLTLAVSVRWCWQVLPQRCA